MHTITNQRLDERRSLTVHAASALPRSRSHRHDPVRTSQHRPRCWALVQVWDGAVLATYDDEAHARHAISCLDDDEVVVLHVGA